MDKSFCNGYNGMMMYFVLLNIIVSVSKDQKDAFFNEILIREIFCSPQENFQATSSLLTIPISSMIVFSLVKYFI